MKLLIFDFDGTIADTKTVYYNSIGGELRMLGYREKDVDKALDIGMSLRRTLKRLHLGFISRFIMRRKIMKNVEKYTRKIKKCKDVDYIKSIEDKKILVTNSLKEFALPILKHLKLERDFSEIYGADDFSDKSDFIKSYIESRGLEKSECFYIGDRVADIKLARKVGCVSVVISGKCSWNSRADLLKARPDFILQDLGDLKKVFRG